MKRQFGHGEALPIGYGALGGFFGVDVRCAVGVVLFFEWVVDGAAAVQVAAYYGPIGFSDVLVLELLSKQAGGVWVEGEQERAGGGAVETVDGVNVLPDLVAQGLQHEAGFLGGNGAAVYQHPGGFVYGDAGFVAVEDVEHIGRKKIPLRNKGCESTSFGVEVYEKLQFVF